MGSEGLPTSAFISRSVSLVYLESSWTNVTASDDAASLGRVENSGFRVLAVEIEGASGLGRYIDSPSVKDLGRGRNVSL